MSIAEFGGLPLLASLGLMALLCGYLALYPALAFYCVHRFNLVRVLPYCLPFIWLISEYLRGWMLTGFPWLSLGYSQLHSPLSGWIPILGEFGLSGITIFIASSIVYGLVTQQKRWTITPVLVLMLSGYLFNHIQWTKPEGSPITVAMMQGNIQQALRWVPEQDKPTMDKYWHISEEHWDANIMIWPESAIPKLEITATDFLGKLDQQALNTQTGFITGIVDYNFETKQAFNNLLSLGQQLPDTDQAEYRYKHNNRFSKHQLLPIGEFVPFEGLLRKLAPIFDLPMSSFSRGAYQQANLQSNGYQLAPAICFEIAFARQINANLLPETDFIITVSNDAWFGDSHGPHQHLEIAQMRAKEFGLPVFRGTNNGITAFIDHRGQIQSRLPQFTTSVLKDQIQPVTGYTLYRKAGDSLTWLLAMMLAVFGFIKVKSRRN